MGKENNNKNKKKLFIAIKKENSYGEQSLKTSLRKNVLGKQHCLFPRQLNEVTKCFECDILLSIFFFLITKLLFTKIFKGKLGSVLYMDIPAPILSRGSLTCSHSKFNYSTGFSQPTVSANFELYQSEHCTDVPINWHKIGNWLAEWPLRSLKLHFVAFLLTITAEHSGI